MTPTCPPAAVMVRAEEDTSECARMHEDEDACDVTISKDADAHTKQAQDACECGVRGRRDCWEGPSPRMTACDGEGKAKVDERVTRIREGVRGGAGVGGVSACDGIVEYDEICGVRSAHRVQYPEAVSGGSSRRVYADSYTYRHTSTSRGGEAGRRDEPITHPGPSNDACVQLQAESAENQLERGGRAAVVTRETDPQSITATTSPRARTGPAGDDVKGRPSMIGDAHRLVITAICVIETCYIRWRSRRGRGGLYDLLKSGVTAMRAKNDPSVSTVIALWGYYGDAQDDGRGDRARLDGREEREERREGQGDGGRKQEGFETPLIPRLSWSVRVRRARAVLAD
ncbi:hypothetical protein B0H17DRAFT_1134293 [Mycena rosella]|uniref:Uncharacterized protein n=1 Tax=Mycena rosella TaxID=1033263 RepID=A0AAD7GIC8_MYCRO|nr:hypothetical protein B0H17DRAFT_1134293 [Mycena rosella]